MQNNEDRAFWMIVRRALLLFVDAIEKRYLIGKYAQHAPMQINETDSVSGTFYQD